jgi:hypothetical protein
MNRTRTAGMVSAAALVALALTGPAYIGVNLNDAGGFHTDGLAGGLASQEQYGNNQTHSHLPTDWPDRSSADFLARRSDTELRVAVILAGPTPVNLAIGPSGVPSDPPASAVR